MHFLCTNQRLKTCNLNALFTNINGFHNGKEYFEIFKYAHFRVLHLLILRSSFHQISVYYLHNKPNYRNHLV